MFCKKGIIGNFAKFTGKQLWQSLFFDKVAGLRPATSLKKRLWHRRFPLNFVKFLNTFSYRTPLVAASESMLAEKKVLEKKVPYQNLPDQNILVIHLIILLGK